MRRSAEAATNAAPDTGLRQARQAVLDAEDELSAATSALSDLKAEVAPRERDLERATERIKQAARAVMSDETKEWPSQILRLHEHYIAQMATMYWLLNQDIVQDDDPDEYAGRQVSRPNDPLLRNGPAETLLYHLFTTGVRQEVQSDSHPARLAWQQVLTKLMTDPDTRLPE